MTPDRFRECLRLIDWSQRGVADLLDIDQRQISRWAKGEYAIPKRIGDWLEKLARFHEQNPPPSKSDT